MISRVIHYLLPQQDSFFFFINCVVTKLIFLSKADKCLELRRYEDDIGQVEKKYDSVVLSKRPPHEKKLVDNMKIQIKVLMFRLTVGRDSWVRTSLDASYIDFVPNDDKLISNNNRFCVNLPCMLRPSSRDIIWNFELKCILVCL